MEYLHRLHYELTKYESMTQHAKGAGWENFLETYHVNDMPIVNEQDWVFYAAVCVPFYLLLVFGGPAFMAKRNPIRLNFLFTVWNLFLTLLSVYMVVTILYPMAHFCYYNSVWEFFCMPNENHKFPWHGIQFWGMWLFAISKFLEFGDTFFLVVRKKPLSLLHWYHHTTVLVFTWYLVSSRAPQGWVFAVMNAMVHSVMYFYYFLTGLKIRPWWAVYITQMQIAQMVIGVLLSAYWAYLVKTGFVCPVAEGQKDDILWAGLIIYGSYLILFAQYYVRRWNDQKQKTAASKAKNAKKNK